MQHPAQLLYQTTLRKAFPPVQFAFAYGSAVFQQHGRAKGKMLDLIFVVDDPTSWHQANMAYNPHHYSFMRFFGPRTIRKVQRYSAGVYYNTLVTVDSQLLKYGVIGTEDLLDDLLNWRWLYVAGRLHKPVVILTDQPAIGASTEVNGAVSNAISQNLSSAALCASLLCGEGGAPFSKESLFMNVAALSYRGDFRMIVGEDRDKVKNIVKPYIKEFHELYKNHLAEFVLSTSDDMLKLKDHVTVSSCIDRLPSCVAQRARDKGELQQALSRIVYASSWRQSMKGIVTAGLHKTLVYSAEKLVKMVKSM